MRPSRSEACVSIVWKRATFQSFVRCQTDVVNVVGSITLKCIEGVSKDDKKSIYRMKNKRSKNKSRRNKRVIKNPRLDGRGAWQLPSTSPRAIQMGNPKGVDSWRSEMGNADMGRFFGLRLA